MEKVEYPKWKFHPEKEAVIVQSQKEERKLGPDWADSPAEYGVETCPGEDPDPGIASKRMERV